jgi:hypothetical protein
MYRERMGRRIAQDDENRHRIARQRSRRERWAAKGTARVEHPAHGSVVVPHRSNFSAVLNAAEVWGCDWIEIIDAKVWAAPGETPVKSPRLI